MTTLNAIKSITLRGVSAVARQQTLWIILLVVALGVLLGQGISSVEQGDLIVSIVVVIAVLALSLFKPLATVIVWIFFFPFLEGVINIPLGAGIPDLSFSRFTIAFLVIAILAQAAIGKMQIRKIGVVEVLIVLSAIGIALAGPMSLPSATSIYQMAISLYLTPFIAYYVCKNVVQDRADLQAILWAIAILGTVSALYAAYEHATGNILFYPREKAVDALKLVRGGSNIRLIVGIYGSAGAMGRMLAMCIPVTFHLFLESKARGMTKLVLAAMLAIQGYSLVVCMCRAPWYSLLVALFVMQLFDKRFRKLFVAIAIVGVLLVGLTWNRVSESNVAARLNDETSTYEGREARWITGFNMWRARPIRGWGFGKFEREAWRFRTDSLGQRLRAPENDYLVVAIGSGLLGLLPYLGVLLIPLWYSLRLVGRIRSLRRQGLPWPGFVKTETLGLLAALIVCFLVFSFSAANVIAGTKLVLLTLGGAIAGSHEHLLRRTARVTDPGAREAQAVDAPCENLTTQPLLLRDRPT
jgi:O-antigen ligase